MDHYYGVVRSDSNTLSHYGIRGMKWGVRKAKENRDSKALSKQYQKALKKAKKLNTKANISKSKAEYKGRMTDAGMALGAGALLAGGSLGLRSMARASNSHIKAVGVSGFIPFYYDSETAPQYAVPMGAGLGALGAYQLGKGIAAKYRTTAKGHVKAKEKAENWKKEMKRAFKGTKYSQLPGANGENKPYGYVPASKQIKSAALDSVTYPGYSMSREIARGASSNHKKKKGRR